MTLLAWIPTLLIWLGWMLLGGAFARATIASREWEAFNLGIDTLAAKLYQDRRITAQEAVAAAAAAARKVQITWRWP